MRTICTIKTVQANIDVSKTKAADMISLCRDALGREKQKPVYFDEFCEYYNL